MEEEAEAEQHRTAASSKDEAEKKKEARKQARASTTPELRAADVKDAKVRATQHAASAALIADLRADGEPSLISTAAEIRFKEKQKKAAKEAELIAKKGADRALEKERNKKAQEEYKERKQERKDTILTNKLATKDKFREKQNMKSAKNPIDPDGGDLDELSEVYQSPDEYDQRDSDVLRSSISSDEGSGEDNTESGLEEDDDFEDEDDLADVNMGRVTQQSFTFKAWKDSRSLVSASCPKVDRAFRWTCRICC